MYGGRFKRLQSIAQKTAGVARIQISEWSEFFRLLNFFSRRTSGWQWIFRGQLAADWPLKSSLERDIEKYVDCSGGIRSDAELSQMIDVVVQDERRIIEEFRQYARGSSMNLAGLPNGGDSSLIECLAMLQHYGSKTRILDFTYSLGVAAYFAYEERCTGKSRSIWALNIDALVARIPKMMEEIMRGHDAQRRVARARREYVDWPLDCTRVFQGDFIRIANEVLEGKGWHERGVIPIRLMGNNPRLNAQNGMSLFPMNAESFTRNLSRLLDVEVSDLEKLTMPAGPFTKLVRTDDFKDYTLLKIDFAAEMEVNAWNVLEQMQMVPRMLFPDLNGLAKGMRFSYVQNEMR